MRQKIGNKNKTCNYWPVTYLLLGKEKEEGFHRIDLIKNLLPVYIELLKNWMHSMWNGYSLMSLSCHWILTEEGKKAFNYVYNEIKKAISEAKNHGGTYFEGLRDNLRWLFPSGTCFAY